MWDLIVSVPGHCLSFYFTFITVFSQHCAGVTLPTVHRVSTRFGVGGMLSGHWFLPHVLCSVMCYSPRCIVGMEAPFDSVMSKCNTYKYHSDWRSSHRLNYFKTRELVAIVSNDLGMVTSRSDRLLTGASRNRVNFVCTGNLNTFFLYSILYNKNLCQN